MDLQGTNISQRIDELELAMISSRDKVDCPLTHRFLPGQYIREIFMPKGTVVTSLKHKTCHPFFILKGKVSVYSENDGEQLLEAPYIGVTKPGTRRVLYIHEDTVWATAHPTDIQPKDDTVEAISEAVGLIEVEIIEPHFNNFLEGRIKNNIISPSISNI